jgi:low affinity Fe/Cu permease
MEPRIPSRTPFSRVVHELDRLLAHSAVAGVAFGLIAVFVVALAIAGFPQSWEVTFSTIATAITLVMVFVVHHTQRREQAETQLKIDELIRALPQADDHFVRIDAASDEEVEALEQRHIRAHRETRAG